MIRLLVFLVYLCALGKPVQHEHTHEVSVFSVVTSNIASSANVMRLLRSAEVHGVSVELLGTEVEWLGFGQKVNLLREKLLQLASQRGFRYNGEREHIVLFVDSDVIFLSGLADIVKTFQGFSNTKILFSAEENCWPDESLASQFPASEVNPYLNSGGFIGYLPELLQLMIPMNDTYDDQLYFTEVYIDPDKRNALQMTLDHRAKIFLCMQRSRYKLSANPSEESPYMEHSVTRERPLILHGHGGCKSELALLYTYLSRSWYFRSGCSPSQANYNVLREDSLPYVTVAAFIEQPTPQLADFLTQLLKIDYPKSKIHLVLRNTVEGDEKEVATFYSKHAAKFASSTRISPSDVMSEADARNAVKENCLRSEECDYVFVIDSVAHVHGGTLRKLLSSGLDVVAPMLMQSGDAWANFWGCISVAYNKVGGVWKVPCVNNCYLIRANALFESVSYNKTNVDPDVAFCDSLRDLGIDIHVNSEYFFGHLVAPIDDHSNSTGF